MKRLRDIVEGYLHHISPSDHKEFHALSHFGTSKSAFQAGKYKNRSDKAEGRPVVHYKVRINKGNVHKLTFDSGEHYPSGILDQLHHEKVFTDKEVAAHHKNIDAIHKKHGVGMYESHPEAAQYLGNALRDKGIHTLEYRNRYEHPGTKSYMITHPSQVTVVKKHVGVKTEHPETERYKKHLEKLFAKPSPKWMDDIMPMSDKPDHSIKFNG